MFKAIINIGTMYTGSNTVINNCSILIEKELIKEISLDKKNHFGLSKDQIIDANNKIIIPGFIDGHTHPIFHGSRAFEIDYKLQGMSYSQIAEKGGGINYTTSKTREASKKQLKSNLKAFCDNALKTGTTSAEIKTGYHLNSEGELLELEIIEEVNNEHEMTLIPTFLGAHLVPKEFKNNPEDYVNLIIEMISEVKNQGIAHFTDVFCDKGAFTVDQTMAIIKESINHNIPVRLHGEEIVRTGIAQEAATKYGGKWIKSVDHLLKATYEDFEILAKNGITATFMPIGPIVLFDQQWPQYNEFSNIQNLLIGLGSDFNPNSWFYSMQTVMSLATYFMKIPPHQGLISATKNNANSLLLQERGILEVGMKADLVLMNVENVSEISYQFGANNVDKVLKEGKLIIENRKT